MRLLEEDGVHNYSEIEEKFDTSSDVISDRLRELVAVGLLNRNERSPRDVRYTITADWQELTQILDDDHRLLDE
jgi:DNA-binding HxlR family transcriptional regulator